MLLKNERNNKPLHHNNNNGRSEPIIGSLLSTIIDHSTLIKEKSRVGTYVRKVKLFSLISLHRRFRND